MKHRDLPLPVFYDHKSAERWGYHPKEDVVFAAAEDWRRAHAIKPSGADTTNVHLLLIDVQRDFCHPEGALFVGGRSGRGAIDDSRRVAEFIYTNLDVLTAVTTTMDTHFSHQIFFPSFWVDREGAPLTAHRTLTTRDVDAGEARPNPSVAKWLCGGNYPWLVKQTRHYCEELERAGKYTLYLWPPHCLLGSAGHALVGAIHEARLFHSYVRGAQSYVEVKGGNPLTENYSVLSPEVLTRFDGQPLGQRNSLFLKTLLAADAVIIAGQAASHCVKSSIDDILSEIASVDAALAKKIYLLTDCMSSVAIPDGRGGLAADFTPEAERALAKFAAAGMNLVKSTDAIDHWLK